MEYNVTWKLKKKCKKNGYGGETTTPTEWKMSTQGMRSHTQLKHQQYELPKFATKAELKTRKHGEI